MGLFTPYDKEPNKKAAQEPTKPEKKAGTNKAEPTKGDKKAKLTKAELTKAEPQAESTSQVSTKKKSIPTPTRKQAEQARRDRIQPVLTKKQSKEKEREARYKTRDEQMAKTHALPYNGLIRDWVDHRWNIAEFALPGMLIVFVLTIIGGYFWAPLMSSSVYVIWGVFGILILDVALMWFGLRNQLKIHFPYEPMKGKFSYAISRAMLMRRSRIPQPRVKRGATFRWPYKEES